jgi:hypothetical protein
MAAGGFPRAAVFVPPFWPDRFVLSPEDMLKLRSRGGSISSLPVKSAAANVEQDAAGAAAVADEEENSRIWICCDVEGGCDESGGWS